MAEGVAERFRRETADHQMTVLHTDGLYRHLHFHRVATVNGKPLQSSMYWFDLVTWPGYLTITGDCGTYTFARLDDMFEFFRGGTINPGYWAEKVRGCAQVQTYSPERFRQLVTETAKESAPDFPGLPEAAEQDILSDLCLWNTEVEDGAREALRDFEFEGFRFKDAWEWDLRDYDWQFLWCCHAIQWGIGQYDQSRTPAAAGVPGA